MDIELHCHSCYSRGGKLPTEAIPRPAEIIRQAKRAGLGGTVLADHNTARGWNEAKAEARRQGILFIPGMELSTADGHLLALGLAEPIPSGLPVEETMDLVHRQGGIGVSSHPYDIKGDGMRDKIRHVDAVEAFNSMNLDRLANRIARRRASLFGKPATAGSDAHTLEMVGLSRNRVEGDSVDTVLRSIRKGRVSYTGRYIHRDMLMRWTRLRFLGSYRHVQEHISRNYSPPRGWLANRMLRRYVSAPQPTPLWKLLGSFSLSCARVYSRAKLWRYC